MASRSFIDYLLNPGPDEVPLQEAIRSAAGVADDIAAAFVLIDAAVAATAADVVTVNAQVTYIDGVVAAFDVDAAAAIAAIAADRASALAAIGAASSTSLTDINTAEDAALAAISALAASADAAITTGLSDISDAVTAGNASLTATGSTITTDLNIIKADTEGFRDEAETARDEAVAAAASVNIPVIAPGDAGKVLTVNATEDGTEWGDGGTGSGVPPGGTTGQYLVKLSGTDGDAGWDDLPTGTELQAGILELATDAEAVAAVDASKAMTPSTVKAYIDSLGGVSAGDAAGVTFTDAGTGAEQRNVKQRLLERVSVLDYMTTAERNDVIAGTLSVDVSAAFNDAFAAAKHVTIPDYSYLINGTVNLLDDLSLDCDNALLVTTQATITMMLGTGKKGFRIKGNLRFQGTYAANAARTARSVSSQFGLVLDSCYGHNIDNVQFDGFRGKGMYVHGTNGAMPAGSYGDRGYVASCRSKNCEIGLQIDDQSAAEYMTWTHLDLFNCYVGLQHGGGNHVMQGGTIGYNTTGIKLLNGGVNHLHGVIQGMQINHNVTPLEATDVQSGQDFIGCHIYQGRLVFNGCADINFIGGMMDLDGIDLGAGTQTPGPIWFKQVHFRNGYTPKTILGAFKHMAFFVDCDGPGAVNWSADGAAYAVGYRTGSDAAQNLTSGVQAALLFPNALGNVGGWFDTATGAYVLPDAGLYELWWELLFNCSAGAADASLVASYISLQTATAAAPTVWGNSVLSLPKTFGNYKLGFNGKVRLRSGKGDRYRLAAVIVGTAPTFTDSDWLSLFGARRVGN